LGSPQAASYKIYLELELIKARIPLTIGNLSNHWTIVDYEMPFGWRGRLITLSAVAESAGEFGISQPFGRGTGDTRQYGLVETTTAWLTNGLLYGAIFVTLARFLARRDYVSACWIPLAACGAVASIGYLAFWSYFASPTFGRLFSIAIFSAVALVNFFFNGRFDQRDREWLRAGCTAVFIGAFYIGIFNLFPSHLDFYDLASNRFIAGLSGDNRLPFDFADMIYHGQRPRELGAGWLSSDRPPLQEGWRLVSWPVTEALGFSDQTASATASIWFQLSWVLALYGLLRSMGLQGARAVFGIAAASLNGFFLVHTLFTWPKLSAGAFACGTFGMRVFCCIRHNVRGKLLGGVFAGLACLSHGGAAFALLPFLPWILWRCFTGESKKWVLVAIVFILTVAPWLAYQHYYAPPGNRLLKMHLAGQFEIDDRPVWQTISDAYRSLTWKQLLEMKASNLALLFKGDWLNAADWSTTPASGRRADEYYHMFRALGWWNLALPLCMVAVISVSFRKRISELSHDHLALVTWIASSIATWCLLMFTQTVIHQGSFAVMIAIFALYASLFEAVGRWSLPCVVALQGYTFVSTWNSGNSVVSRHPSAEAVALVAVTIALAGAVSRRLRNEGSDDNVSAETRVRFGLPTIPVQFSLASRRDHATAVRE
jgi:hypothetical protein